MAFRRGCVLEIPSQCPKKLRTGFRHGAIDKKPQDLVFSNPWLDGVLRHDTHPEFTPLTGQSTTVLSARYRNPDTEST